LITLFTIKKSRPDLKDLQKMGRLFPPLPDYGIAVQFPASRTVREPFSRQITSKPCPLAVGSQLSTFTGSEGCGDCRERSTEPSALWERFDDSLNAYRLMDRLPGDKNSEADLAYDCP
jgi:hypothetical protein